MLHEHLTIYAGKRKEGAKDSMQYNDNLQPTVMSGDETTKAGEGEGDEGKTNAFQRCLFADQFFDALGYAELDRVAA
jgi:hypothetical protein